MNAEIEIRVQEELQRIIADPDNVIAAYQKSLEKRDLQIADMRPKAKMWEIAMGTDQLFEMSAVAKILNFRNMGRNNLFEYLKDKKLLRYNKEPYQQYVDSGCFKIVEQSFDAGNGVQIYRKTMATQKGIDYIGKLLKGDEYEPNAR